MAFLTGKKLLLLGFIIVLLVIIPLTVYLVQQQQKVTSLAAATSVLSVVPPTESMTVGETKPFEVRLNPVNNQVSFVKLVLKYDPAKLETAANRVTINTAAFPSTLQVPTVASGVISLTVSVGSDPNKNINQPNTLVATISFTALEATTGTTRIEFDRTPNQTQVLSIASSDQFNENVLADGIPSNVTITGSGTSPSPGAGSVSENKIPVCTNLNVDRPTTGTAPYSVTFTVIGNDSDGTVNKVTFNYGDGPQEDVTTGGGLGTNSINLQKAHTYNNAGNFTATATLTDNSGGVSEVGSCTQSMTVNASGTGTGTGTGTIITVSPTPSSSPSASIVPTATPITSLPDVGPSDFLAKFGGAAALLTIIGVILLFAL